MYKVNPDGQEQIAQYVDTASMFKALLDNGPSGVGKYIGEVLQDGYIQEYSDKLAAPYSTFSYEDLPIDKFGTTFGAKYFDPNSKLTLGEQIENYLINILEAPEPQNAPNFYFLPLTNDQTQAPTRTNITSKPVYTEEYP